MRIAFAIAFLIATASNAEPSPVSKHIQKIISKRDGLSPSTAFKVSSVRDEYQIADALNLKVLSQTLVFQKKPFDMFKAQNAAGETREIWFDISSFYPEI